MTIGRLILLFSRMRVEAVVVYHMIQGRNMLPTPINNKH